MRAFVQPLGNVNEHLSQHIKLANGNFINVVVMHHHISEKCLLLDPEDEDFCHGSLKACTEAGEIISFTPEQEQLAFTQCAKRTSGEDDAQPTCISSRKA